MATILIDNREIEIPPGRRINGIEAAKLAGIDIPYYCWHPGLSVVGSCRMCLVEVGSRDPKTGKITMQPKLVAGLQYAGRRQHGAGDQQRKGGPRPGPMVEEGLLLRHPIDCPICDKAGECVLQDYHFRYGQKDRRADIGPFTSRRRDLGDVTLFVDRCVLCSRCVRFAAEISGTNELMFTGRGAHEEIDVVAGFPLNNKLSGNVVDLCPVGALGDKDFLYRQRVWYLRQHRGVCTGCATGCSIWIEENQDRIYRIKPRENLLVNKWWICNDGRYDYPHVHNPAAFHAAPTAAKGDRLVDAPTGAVCRPSSAMQLQQGRAAGRRHFAVSDRRRGLSACAGSSAASMPRRGWSWGPCRWWARTSDFPRDSRSRAEKCPNRRGVEAIIAHFAHGQ